MNFHRYLATVRSSLLILAFILLSGCRSEGGGAAYGGDGSGSGGGSGTGNEPFVSAEQLFQTRASSQMDYCVACHVAGGVADTDEGRGFILSSDATKHYDDTYAAWEGLGKGVESNPLIVENSDLNESHSGGKSWPVGSPQYAVMVALLKCWDNPANCTSGLELDEVEQLPLLGSSHAKFVWESFCETQPDNATLPVDPRTLIVPGVNEGRAVYYNAWFEECHAALPKKDQAPTTCGEYRSSRDIGEAFMLGRIPGVGTSSQALGQRSAADFDSAWEQWGEASRPANYEQLYTLRYGQNIAPFDNPYPLAGEDPNATDGGSGNLPMGVYQIKDDNQRWTGELMTVACFSCHGGQMGDPYAGEELAIGLKHIGLGNNNTDTIMFARDGTGPLAVAPGVSADALFNLGVGQRGQNNAVGAFEVLFAALDYDSLGISGNLNKSLLVQGQDFDHPTGVAQDTPPWWNYSHRSRKFFDAGQSIDSQRIVLAATPDLAVTPDGKAYREAIEKYDQDVANFLVARESPEYPREIDEELAKQGAVLFHAKNLWAEEGNADKPKPLGGNGSCASCHGAYSPRFINDPTYLESPVLEGVAGHISPLAVIGTDTARADTLTPYLRDAYSTTFWAYPDGAEGWTHPDDKNLVVELADDILPNRPEGACGWERSVIGYQAPPLYGAWATAPYLHNGSVPNLEAVLDSSKRPAIWQRKLQTIGGVTGFDQRVNTAFDWDALGWKYDELSCDQIPGDDFSNCNPTDPTQPSFPQLVENFLYGTVNWSTLLGFVDPYIGDIDRRLVYDTRVIGNSAGGHDFSDVLTDSERAAIIEYIKTL